jgi:type II secretory pathway pseudopilin PulG
MKNKKSFTLIELLVVIAVLAGMMALMVPNFMSVREKSRDVKRKSDLKGLQKALELYAQNQPRKLYPTGLAPCQIFNDSNGVVYMQKAPVDPLVSCSSITSKYYYVQPTPGDYFSYRLGACLENGADPEAIDCPTGFNSNSEVVPGYVCASAKCYILQP